MRTLPSRRYRAPFVAKLQIEKSFGDEPKGLRESEVDILEIRAELLECHDSVLYTRVVQSNPITPRGSRVDHIAVVDKGFKLAQRIPTEQTLSRG
ncbi:MAG TPA: hypothetical protein VNF91_00410, partial [Candidatus Acidoferrum sp.]|nr:hypothetical protein [Candidatus Acidoferrum sp.]